MSPEEAVAGANATIFGPYVYVFDPSMPAAAIQDKAISIFQRMESNEFSAEGYALLFKPGIYSVLFDVGFYTHVAGLGLNPDDVLIDGGANVPAYWMPNRNATCNFWRSFENLAINASGATNRTTTIAVSQAAPLRRLHIKSPNGLWLFQVDPATGAGGYASGGYMADSVVDGQVLPGSQQQWLSRNSKWGSWANGVWNMVFLGSINAPSQANFPTEPYTTIESTPIIREKPYLYSTGDGKYAVFVPALQKATQGPSWTGGATPGKSMSIDDFCIVQPPTANASSINSELRSGKHVLFTPGVYMLDEAIEVTNSDTIILGLGLPSLIPTRGNAAIRVADVDGVTIAGLIIDAGTINSATLLEVGYTGQAPSVRHNSNPTFLYDLTVRTAGRQAGRNDVGIIINSHDTVCDQIWLWRADHGPGAGWETNPSKNGIIVNGDDVTIYGLFNEHHKEYQTLWNGNNGRVYFYQSEIPYDPPNQESWRSVGGTRNGYASYKVADHVTSHEAWGLGVYSYFRDAPVKLENAIEVPSTDGVKLHHLTTIWLNGVAGSEITHIVNGTGGRVYANNPPEAMRQVAKEFPGQNPGTPDPRPPPPPPPVPRSSKRGLCWPVDNKDSVTSFTRPGTKVSWLYNWSPDPQPNTTSGMLEFVPMQWNHVNIDELGGKLQSSGARTLLGFNEPELGDQSNMSVELAAREWVRCIEPLRKAGVRAGSPGISSAPHGVGWLRDFLAAIRAGGSDVDFYCLHWYGEALGGFYDHIWSAYHQLGPDRPVWITEFACTNWSRDAPLPREHVEEFARESARYLDTLEWVERYAWFGPMRDTGTVGRWAAMLDAEGNVTPLGRAYRDD
ncbi:glycosyl hydrolase catalytic core-domain-containing protein [Truncatella angustata]|uniref:Glycosyl hydrolase catalytic core-domain-containing protein n=1 Tax=Truncatella angustata TaxID=152316 RepID=A0A9P9A1I5_9PEZI|nr:glycosyl hydrolase catalytic core-domain-containing protein [Truncatella angustata]KAH6658129.1 glycosyl hydrolase catalytic core-domain-containing protein [Truncatella angustata]